MLARYREIFLAVTLLLVSSFASAATFHITAGGGSNVFTPNNLTINVGDTVTWSNAGGFHNVAADNGSFRNGNPSSSMWTFSQTFNTAGSVSYHCEIHGGMVGTITINNVAPTMNLGGYLSGNWFIPAQGGGHGFQLEFTTAVSSTSGLPQMLAIWFVYTPAGSTANDGSGQNWIYAQGDFDPSTNTVTLPAVLLAGARFPPNFNPNDVHFVPADGVLWGHLTFSFSDCNNGTVSWHSDLPGYNGENDTPLAIQRLTQIAGTTCPQ
jgi:plastocyanin